MNWTDVVSALASLLSAGVAFAALRMALIKLPEWVNERRSVHRSEIATRALVSALGLLDALEEVFAEFSFGSDRPENHAVSNFRNALRAQTHEAGVDPAWREFLREHRAAVAVLDAKEVAPLREVRTLWLDMRRAQQAFAEDLARVKGSESAHREGSHGEKVRARIEAARKNLIAVLQPIARMSDADRTAAEPLFADIETFEAPPPRTRVAVPDETPDEAAEDEEENDGEESERRLPRSP